MVIPRFYNKRLKYSIPILMTVMFCVVSFNRHLTDEINQFLFEQNGLKLNKESSFNPREITYAVFSYVNSFSSSEVVDFSGIGDERGIYFHWDDWVDLYPGEKVLGKYRNEFSEGLCDSRLTKFASVNGYFIETYEKKVLRGMANLYCLHDIPKRVMLFTDKSMVEVPVVGKKRLGKYRLPANINKELLVNEMTKFQLLSAETTTSFKIHPFKKLKKEIRVDAEDFVFNPKQEISSLKEKLLNNTLAASEKEYLEFLEYSNKLVQHSDTYFKYPWIITDLIQGKSHHLAYPFFKRYISDRERQSVIHHIVRAWFQFAEANDFASWINYGSLLGWVYNGVNMPWDTDVDVQMPITHLDRLGREFNRTLVIENPRLGNGKYLLEISPTYIRQGNGKNFIDARFIDTHTGLYIDISALSHSEYSPPIKSNSEISESERMKNMLVHCKNWNWHDLGELIPLKHTYFEGASVYIPNNATKILARKYGKESLTNYHFLNHNYQDDIKLWVPDRICANPPSKSRFKSLDKTQLSLEGACYNHYLQDEYRINYETTQRHMSLNNEATPNSSHDPESLNDLPIFRKDAWDFYNDINQNLVKDDLWYTREEAVF